MAIPTPTVPSAITAVGATSLRPTQNNKAFSINSGLVSADNTETTVISVNDIGKRDILLCINPVSADRTGDHMTMKVKNNGSIIFQEQFSQESTHHPPYVVHFIIPANTSIEVTFTNSDSTSHNVGVSAYGYYL